MTKSVTRITHDSLEGSSSLFHIDFTSEGLSWVKGFCQKLETSCNEYVDTCHKYVNVAGEQLKKIYDEVWEDPCPTEEPDSDLCLKHDCVTEMSRESSVELQEISSKDKMSGSPKLQLTVSMPEDSGSTAICSKDEVATEVVACVGEKEESFSTGATDCLDNMGENCKEPSFELQEICSKEKMSACDQLLLTESIPEYSGPTAICGKDEVAIKDVACTGEKKELLPTGAIDFLDNTRENCKDSADSGIIHSDPTSSSVHCIQLFKPDNIKKRLPLSESASSEQVDGTDIVREESNLSTSIVIIENLKTEEFEAVKLEDFCDGSERNEIALISLCQAAKNMSFKKRLRNVFTGMEAYSAMQYKDTSSTLSLPTEYPYPKLPTQDSIESGWELL